MLATFAQIEDADNRFIKNTMKAVAEQKVQEIDIASLLLVNRLFTQACRMQIYVMKDMLLPKEQAGDFDRALENKGPMPTGRKRLQPASE